MGAGDAQAQVKWGRARLGAGSGAAPGELLGAGDRLIGKPMVTFVAGDGGERGRHDDATQVEQDAGDGGHPADCRARVRACRVLSECGPLEDRVLR